MNCIKHVVTHDNKHYGYRFHCPGCDSPHIITTEPYPNGWKFNGDEAAPTFSPSILVHEIKRADGSIYSPRCHSFVVSGKIQFLADSTHSLAGQTADLPELNSSNSFGSA